MAELLVVTTFIVFTIGLTSNLKSGIRLSRNVNEIEISVIGKHFTMGFYSLEFLGFIKREYLASEFESYDFI